MHPAAPVLLVNSGGEAAVPEWQEQFARCAPHLQVRWWDDPHVSPEQVAYVFLWAPQPGRLAELPNLRLILSSGAGVEHITGDPDWPRGVGIVRMGGAETVQRMGEYVCLGALCLLRGTKRIVDAQARRTWDNFDAPRTAPETRVGVMGLGNLGARAAEMLQALGFPVHGWSRSRKRMPRVESFAGDEELPAFLGRTDLLVCLLPETPETRGILRAETLALLPPGAAVLNAARGSHVVAADLLDALDRDHLSGAFLDVFEEEPLPPDHPLWTNPKVIVTPHVASLASRRARAQYVGDAIAAFERGEVPPNLYDPGRGY